MAPEPRVPHDRGDEPRRPAAWAAILAAVGQACLLVVVWALVSGEGHVIAPGEVRGGDAVPLQIVPVFIAGRDVQLPVGATFEGTFNECAWVDTEGNVVESPGCVVNWGIFRFGHSRIEIDSASGEILSEYVIGDDEAAAAAIKRQLPAAE